MGKYDLTIGNKVFEVEAEDESALPEIADEIFKAEFGGGKSLFGNTSLKDRTLTASLSGLMPSVMGVTPKDAVSTLPMTGQTIGGAFGGYGGAVAGETVGDTAKQVFEKFLLGTRENISPKEIALNTGVTAATEGLFRLPAAKMFKKARAINELEKGAGVKLAQAKDILNKSGASLEPNVVTGWIDDALSSVRDARGSAGATLRKFKREFSKLDKITPDDLFQLRDSLGESVSFDLTKGKKNKYTQNAAKIVGKKVQEMLSGFAEKAGIKNWDELNSVVSKAKKIEGSKDPKLLGSLARGGALSYLGKTIGLSQPAYGAIPLALMALENPSVRKALYYGLEKTGLGRTATLGASEAMRRFIEQ
jgi:hypothetical protein